MFDGMFGGFIADGAPFAYVTLGILAAALALAAERASTLGFRYSLDAEAFLDEVQKLLEAGNVDRARRVCALNIRAPLARVVDAGLRHHAQGERAVQHALDAQAGLERMRVLTRVGWFKPLGWMAALWGGAAAGWDLRLSARASAEALGGGLSETVAGAATNLALGLTVAAACVLLHLLVATYARRMAAFLELGAQRVDGAGRGWVAPDGERPGSAVERRPSLEIAPR